MTTPLPKAFLLPLIKEYFRNTDCLINLGSPYNDNMPFRDSENILLFYGV